MFNWKFNLISIILAGLLSIILAGCSTTVAGPQIVQHDAWGRPSPKMAATSAVYVVIENKGNQADRLVGAITTVADTVELHESFLEGDVMEMRPIRALDVPAGGTVELKPGGYHLMLIEPTGAVAAGNHIPVILKFEKSGDVPLDVEIKE